MVKKANILQNIVISDIRKSLKSLENKQIQEIS